MKKLAMTLSLAACVACGGQVNVPDGGAGFDTGLDGLVPPDVPAIDGPAESCMSCHNGATTNNYDGSGITNPHPFGVEGYVACTTCHGGNGTPGGNRLDSHVPPPPFIGDDLRQVEDPRAWFNRLTLAGIDLAEDYEVDGRTYSGLDFLQFVNPGDLRVVADARGCGTPGCHLGEHVQWVIRMPFGNSSGIISGANYSAGLENEIPDQVGVWDDTANDYAFRPYTDGAWRDRGVVGAVGELRQQPEYAQFSPSDLGNPNNFYNNQEFYDADDMADDVYTAADGPGMQNRLKNDSPLAHAFREAVSITCGDCHLGSSGANNRYGDFRSAGCTACHMEYSPDGRSRSTDPNVNKTEPANPDAIAAPERAHVDMHRIRSVAREVNGGEFQRGISDYTCVGCHQGSNRTVLQFWGIRLDQNQDVFNDRQYPANPDSFQTTAADDRLYDPGIGNATFNGRVPEQYLLAEDYDADGRDDTPPDVHYAAGLGCIDCHGSRDVHNGTQGDPTSGAMISRMDQGVMIQCESCHGSVDDYAEVLPCETYDGSEEMCAVDRAGNALRHVTVDSEGQYWLVSRLNGDRHYLPQTRDVVVDNNRRNPRTGEFIYTRFGSYAMGRADGETLTGIGPLQTDLPRSRPDFSHTDRMDCVSCHSSWTNNCIGCHLSNAYNADPNEYFFSNITGERILLEQDTADFVYQTPVPFYLGVNSRGEITQMAPGIQMFFRYTDSEGQASQIFAFNDRSGEGNNPDANGRDPFPGLGHDAMMPHSIRGRASGTEEGPRYCVSCHMTQDGLDTFGGAYAQFRQQMANNDFENLDYALLQQHIGQNTGNQLGSPFWVHMVAGLGSGLFVFDENGCPLNPLDNFTRPAFCNEAASENFGNVAPAFNLDGLVEPDGTSNIGSAHPARPEGIDQLRQLRRGSQNPAFAGPLGEELIQRLTNPNYETAIILDAWLDADGAAQGNAAALLAP